MNEVKISEYTSASANEVKTEIEIETVDNNKNKQTTTRQTKIESSRNAAKPKSRSNPRPTGGSANMFGLLADNWLALSPALSTTSVSLSLTLSFFDNTLLTVNSDLTDKRGRFVCFPVVVAVTRAVGIVAGALVLFTTFKIYSMNLVHKTFRKMNKL